MALPIITADERLREKQGVKLVLLGKSGIGKTSQLKTLPEASTLFVDLEAGDLAVKDWRGDCVRPATWPEFRDLAVFLAGPNPALPADAPFSEAHHRHVCERYGDPAQLAKYDTYFVDSITVLARLALVWAKTQPQAYSERTGKPDTRGAYGLLGAELIGALTHLQHARGKHVVFVAILDERIDDFNRKVFVPQIEGKAPAQLKAKDYAAKHRAAGAPIRLVGTKFSRESRRVGRRPRAQRLSGGQPLKTVACAFVFANSHGQVACSTFWRRKRCQARKTPGLYQNSAPSVSFSI